MTYVAIIFAAFNPNSLVDLTVVVVCVCATNACMSGPLVIFAVASGSLIVYKHIICGAHCLPPLFISLVWIHSSAQNSCCTPPQPSRQRTAWNTSEVHESYSHIHLSTITNRRCVFSSALVRRNQFQSLKVRSGKLSSDWMEHTHSHTGALHCYLCVRVWG